MPIYRQNNTDVPFEKISRREKRNIQEYVMAGQIVLVQITKDGIGKKGPTLTTYLSIPGRYLVLMPSLSRSGVSRKIEDRKERLRLKRILEEIDPPPGMGYIIRTAGIGRNKEELEKDLQYLLKLWNTIVKRVRNDRSPSMVYQESDLVVRTIRDMFTPDIDEVVVDNEAVYRKICDRTRFELEPKGDGTLLKFRDDTTGHLGAKIGEHMMEGWRLLVVDSFKSYVETGEQPERPASVVRAEGA